MEKVLPKKMHKNEYIHLLAGIIFHPAVTFRQIKRFRDQFSWWSAIIIYALFTVVFVISTVFVHFPFSTQDVRGSHFFIQLIQVLLPLVSWIFAAYLMSSIMDGEMKLKEFAISTAYCLVPATVLLGPVTLLSYLMEGGQAFFYNGAITAILVWTVGLMLGSFKVLNEYEAFDFFKGLVVSFVAIIVIWTILFLLYSIALQFGGALRSLVTEISLLGK